MNERMPKMCSGVTWMLGPVKHADIAYNGLVPMSPNTTPSAATAKGAMRPPELCSPDMVIRG